MLTHDEFKRFGAKMDGSLVLDSNLKEPVLRSQLNDTIAALQTKLKRTRTGGKIAVFWCDLR